MYLRNVYSAHIHVIWSELPRNLCPTTVEHLPLSLVEAFHEFITRRMENRQSEEQCKLCIPCFFLSACTMWNGLPAQSAPSGRARKFLKIYRSSKARALLLRAEERFYLRFLLLPACLILISSEWLWKWAAVNVEWLFVLGFYLIDCLGWVSQIFEDT